MVFGGISNMHCVSWQANRLVSLFKEKSEERDGKVKELEGIIHAMKEHYDEAAEANTDALTSADAARTAAQAEVRYSRTYPCFAV